MPRTIRDGLHIAPLADRLSSITRNTIYCREYTNEERAGARGLPSVRWLHPTMEKGFLQRTSKHKAQGRTPVRVKLEFEPVRNSPQPMGAAAQSASVTPEKAVAEDGSPGPVMGAGIDMQALRSDKGIYNTTQRGLPPMPAAEIAKAMTSWAAFIEFIWADFANIAAAKDRTRTKILTDSMKKLVRRLHARNEALCKCPEPRGVTFLDKAFRSVMNYMLGDEGGKYDTPDAYCDAVCSFDMLVDYSSRVGEHAPFPRASYRTANATDS